jgi:uncharacterized membrane protein YdjX (TVP38/TMEM64 family)
MRRKHLIPVAVIAVLGIGWYLAREHFRLDVLANQETRLRTAIDAHPAASILIALLVYILLTFVPATAGKALVAGWLFGIWKGMLLVNVGLTIAAIGMFWLSRYLLRERMRSHMGIYLARLDVLLERDGAFYLFALRMMHAPYTFLNYAMGATALPTRSFWWATQLGMLPGNLLFAYAGARLPTLREAGDEGLSSVATPGLIAAFVAVGLFPLVARWTIRRLWPRAQEEESRSA